MSLTLDKALLASLVHEEVAFALGPALASELVVRNPYHRRIAEYALQFLERHGSLPRIGDFEMWFDELAERDAEAMREAHGALRRLKIDRYTPAAIVEHGAGVLQNAASVAAVGRLAQVDEEQLAPDVLMKLAEEVDAIRPVSIDGIMDLSRYDTYGRDVGGEARGWPSGVRQLDRITRGFRAGDLVFVLADSGVGKSTALFNFGTAAAGHGARVLHITLELSGPASAMRYYRRMAEASRQEIRADEGEFLKGLETWWRFAGGEVFVLYQPAYGYTPEDLGRTLKLFAQLYGSPDVLVLDYLDLLAPSPQKRRASRYEALGYASHSIRDLGVAHECAVLTAAQARRPRGEFIENMTMAQMGDSYEKVRAADILLGLVQTDAEREMHQARLQFLKVREGARGGDVPVLLYRDYMLMIDESHPTAFRVMRDHGLVPGERIGPDERLLWGLGSD